MVTFKYIVAIAGGLGPDVWDSEFTVEAENIRQALDKAEPLAAEAGGDIIAIEQED